MLYKDEEIKAAFGFISDEKKPEKLTNLTESLNLDNPLNDAYLAASEKGKGAVKAIDIDFDQSLLRGALVAIPADDYNVWINVGIALKGEVVKSDYQLSEETAYDFWLKWSEQSQNFDEFVLQKKWEGFNPTGEKGIGSIFYMAREEYGWKGERRISWNEEEAEQLKALRYKQVEREPEEKIQTPILNNEEDKKLKFDNEIDELNHNNFVVRESGKTRVMTEEYDEILKRRVLTSGTFDDITKYYSNRFVEVESVNNKKQVKVEFKPLGAYWLSSPERRQYKKIVFSPGRDHGPDCYNLWRGWTVAPAQGNWSLLQAHLLDNICSGNQTWFEYLLNWMAFAVQYPDCQASTALVLRGNRGVGKGSAISYFGDLFGQHFLHVTSTRQVTGNFNNHLRDTIVLFSDEAVYAGAKAEEATLKGLITEQYISIEAKGKDLITVKNNLHIVISTNNEWAVPAGFDERRFFVLNVSDAQKQNSAYFEAIKNQMRDAGGSAAMLYDLQRRDISKFNIYDVPKTQALFEQKLQSMDHVTKWWFEKLMDGRLLDYFVEWDKPIPKELLYKDYVNVMGGTWYRSTQVEIGMKLAKFCGEGYPRTIRGVADIFLSDKLENKSQDKRVKQWVFPALDVCRANFEAVIGQTVNWSHNVGSEELIAPGENLGGSAGELQGVEYGGRGEAM